LGTEANDKINFMKMGVMDRNVKKSVTTSVYMKKIESLKAASLKYTRSVFRIYDERNNLTEETSKYG
jgi:hypothetical protein